MKLVKTAIATSILALATTSASAAFDFSNMNMTENSVTFTINGDMSGYASPDYNDQFSIGYEGSFLMIL